MNAEQVLALAGIFQSAALVDQLARGMDMDEAAERASLGSIFMIDAEDVGEVFGGLAGMQLGLGSLIAQHEDPSQTTDQTRMVFCMLQLQRKLDNRPEMNQQLAEGIRATERQRQHFDLLHATVRGRLADLYEQTLSNLRPRVMVKGDPRLLAEPDRVARIRANLLAGVRAAVLWHQLGGRRRHLLLRRRQLLLLARGLLSRRTLEYGP